MRFSVGALRQVYEVVLENLCCLFRSGRELPASAGGHGGRLWHHVDVLPVAMYYVQAVKRRTTGQGRLSPPPPLFRPHYI